MRGNPGQVRVAGGVRSPSGTPAVGVVAGLVFVAGAMGAAAEGAGAPPLNGPREERPASKPDGDFAPSGRGADGGALSSRAAEEPSFPRGSEVDRFMERVFENRREAWRRLGDFDVTEVFAWEMGRAGEPPAARARIEYEWRMRGGVAVRRPVSVDGAPVGAGRRRGYERASRRLEARRRRVRDSRPRPSGRKEREEEVRALIDRTWGGSVRAGLLNAVAGDALLLGDGAAAVALNAGPILESLGGVEAVGFEAALDRAGSLLERAGAGPLTDGEVGRALRQPLAALAERLVEADPAAAARYRDLAARAARLDRSAPDDRAFDRGRAFDPDRAFDPRAGLAAALAGSLLDPGRVEPLFSVDHYYFSEFTFEPGAFYNAGRAREAGRPVLVIEYYPDAPAADGDGLRDLLYRTNRRSRHTFRVDPDSLEVVRHTMENRGVPGLPLRWLTRIKRFQADLSLAPVPAPGGEVWMPASVTLGGTVATALGDFEVSLAREFGEYRRRPAPGAAPPEGTAPATAAAGGASTGEPPAGAGEAAGNESRRPVASEVRVHGNRDLSAVDIRRLAGLEPGAELRPGTEEEAAARLRATGRFETVEARRRRRSLRPGGPEETVILLVEERAPAGGATGLAALPVVRYDEGYGVTYGARLTLLDPFGENSRLSAPLTRGGEDRAAVEFEARPRTGPFSAVRLAASAFRRENPRYGLADRRRVVAAEAERRFGDRFRLSGGAAWSRVRFGAAEERLAAYRAGLALDTRDNPSLPRNGVFVEAGSEWLRWGGGAGTARRPWVDARGFVGLFGPAVLRARAQYRGSDAPLPRFARPLLGGAGSVRGHPVGAAAGDRLAAASVEVRAPLDAPYHAVRYGARIFFEAGAVAGAGEPFRGAAIHRGLGGGLFLAAPLLTVGLDAASDFEGGFRLHLSAATRF